MFSVRHSVLATSSYTHAWVTSLKSSGSPPLSGCSRNALWDGSAWANIISSVLTSSCKLSSDRHQMHWVALRGDRSISYQKFFVVRMNNDTKTRFAYVSLTMIILGVRKGIGSGSGSG